MCCCALDVDHGLDIEIESDVPIGAGLSSSAALECSVAVAVDELLGLGRPRGPGAAASVAESETVGAPTGGLDQTAAIHAEAGHALLSTSPTAREQVPFDPAAHGLAVLVIDTRVSHELTDGGYGSRRTTPGRRPTAPPRSTPHRPPTRGLPEPLLRRAGTS